MDSDLLCSEQCRNVEHKVLAGSEHNIDEIIQDLLSCLYSPELPFLQWQECKAVLANHLPKNPSWTQHIKSVKEGQAPWRMSSSQPDYCEVFSSWESHWRVFTGTSNPYRNPTSKFQFLVFYNYYCMFRFKSNNSERQKCQAEAKIATVEVASIIPSKLLYDSLLVIRGWKL